MAKKVDIIDVMIAVRRGELKASVSNGYFMLENTISGERVRLNEADVAPVVHGRWDRSGYCTVCDWWTCYGSEYKYCPNCGARMDRDEVEA